MCLLTFFPAGVLPDVDALHHGAYFNNDGHGYAIVTDGRLVIQRGLDACALIEAFAAARNRHTGGPALFHSRFGTHGRTSVDNCHPFPVGGDPRTVLAHNGILPTACRPSEHDDRSDTRIAAEDFLPTFGRLRARRTRVRLERWMTRGNKMVILTVDPRFKERAFILNESAGIWDHGIWYSNDGYLTPPQHGWGQDSSAFPADPDWPADGLDRCGFCRAAIGVRDDECGECGGCASCGELPEYCYCSTSVVLRPRARPNC